MDDLGADILRALDRRGLSSEDIRRMTPEQVFDEYCGWRLGATQWGKELRDVWSRVSALSQPKE